MVLGVSFHDMHAVNNDAKSYSGKTPEQGLHEAERGEKRMYLEACLQQRRHFYPFASSVDVLLGVEATSKPKKDIQLPGHKVVATLLEDVQVCQE